MGKNQGLLSIWSAFLLIFLLAPSIEASNSQPANGVPLENIFSVPIGADSYAQPNAAVITTDSVRQVGSIFSTETNKIDMSNSFHAEMYVYLGNKRSTAADGMAFVMHADKAITQKFKGGVGDQLGVYAQYGTPVTNMQQQIKKSFAVEFDTYHNGDTLDRGVNSNGGKGHVAYSFPDQLSSYDTKTTLGYIGALTHNGLYYPNDYLSNDTWHTFNVNWNPTSKILTYNFDNAPTVNVPMDPMSIFGTNSIYWGFTGSTGALSQESKVAFKQVPGLVNIDSSMKIIKDEKDITDIGVSASDGDVQVAYEAEYMGGKQNLINPIFNLELDDYLSYKKGTLAINGKLVDDSIISGGKLIYKLPSNLTASNNKFTVSFVASPKVVTSDGKKSKIKYSLSSDNYINDSEVEMSILKVKIITSADFENQSWIINEINRQLAPKKIDVDVYLPDLSRITKIDLVSAPKIIGEHIPTTIDLLINLNNLRLANQKLTGVLPEELGNLSKITYLSIYGNTFKGEIPQSIGKLQELTLIALDDNNLEGTVPTAIASLPKLNQIYLNKNKLSGQLPEFRMNMGLIHIKDTQLTYNLDAVPSFLTSANSKNYTKTFIEGLKLTGNSKVVSESGQIKPFDNKDKGYFDLKAMDGTQPIDLVEEHSYIIKNTVDGTVYYKGKKNTGVIIPYEKGISYTVILDEAEKNPNNVFTILGKERELKFGEIPISLSLKFKLGAEDQPVVPEGNLTIFDNRENANWKLSITPSNLKQGSKILQGEYTYTDKVGETHSIISEQKYLLVAGKSDSINEIINLSSSWGKKQGLRYKANKSNYIGEYKGSVNWTLEDTP
ncbi:lectin-like domain-containing protein [Carnobacterium maltaromaticum]|uniref:lectin-like domain-containing protein n=1 Tax=Carnobacterium maltaromaticum TaxID=2751 RepID=UPI00295E4723|nr:cell surface protein [Carnobacterium maltaromaticum]